MGKEIEADNGQVRATFFLTEGCVRVWSADFCIDGEWRSIANGNGQPIGYSSEEEAMDFARRRRAKTLATEELGRP